MSTFAVEFPTDMAERLRAEAQRQRISPEELIRLAVDEYLKRADIFRQAMTDTFRENDELYRRLAR